MVPHLPRKRTIILAVAAVLGLLAGCEADYEFEAGHPYYYGEPGYVYYHDYDYPYYYGYGYYHGYGHRDWDRGGFRGHADAARGFGGGRDGGRHGEGERR